MDEHKLDQQEAHAKRMMTEPAITPKDTSLEAKVFSVGFYIPDTSVDLKEFIAYYDEKLAFNLKPKALKTTRQAHALLKEMRPSYVPAPQSKGRVAIVASGDLIGGYMVSTADESSVYGPNGTVAETLALIENAVSDSGMEHGIVMVCISTRFGYAPDHYCIMESYQCELQEVTMAEYLKRSSPWKKTVDQ